jgi:hypothetical protein
VDTANNDVYLSSANNRFQRNTYVLGTNANYFIWAGQDVNESQWRSLGFDSTGSFQR